MLYHYRTSSETCSTTAAATNAGWSRPPCAGYSDSQDQARERITHVIASLEPIAPKVCRLLEDAEEEPDCLLPAPPEHRTKLRSTNPLDRVNTEIGRRSDVVAIFPNDASVIRIRRRSALRAE
jgi:transposase-like protein